MLSWSLCFNKERQNKYGVISENYKYSEEQLNSVMDQTIIVGDSYFSRVVTEKPLCRCLI